MQSVIVTLGLFVIAFAVAAVLLARYTRWVADSALTDKFRAAEAITDGRIPDRWLVQINRRVNRAGAIGLFWRGVSGAELALKELDALYRFFERSPFFESPEARHLLLARLSETRARWGGKTWEEIVAEYGGTTEVVT